MVASPAKQPRASWDADKDSFLVDEILEAHRAGNRDKSGFTKEAWETAITNFNEHFECAYHVSQLKSRLDVVSVVPSHAVHEALAA
jgi:hypothetical protein